MRAFWQWGIRRERAANNGNVNWFGLIVCKVDYGLGRATIDELDPEDLSFWEGNGYRDGKIGSFGFGILFLCLRLWLVGALCKSLGKCLQSLAAQRKRWLHAEPEEREQST
jgi:hypothetical protein